MKRLLLAIATMFGLIAAFLFSGLGPGYDLPRHIREVAFLSHLKVGADRVGTTTEAHSAANATTVTGSTSLDADFAQLAVVCLVTADRITIHFSNDRVTDWTVTGIGSSC